MSGGPVCEVPLPIRSVPDHVAVAVPDIDASLARWRDALGGVEQWRFHNPTLFRGAAVQFDGGAYLELLMPSDAAERVRSIGGPSGFLERFIERHGPTVHHVTLKVPDLHEAVATLGDEGLEAVDVDDSNAHWQEAFLRPSQVGGLVVQVAATDRSATDEAAAEGYEHAGPPASGARLLGPQLRHDDLDRARAVWTTLGGTVTEHEDGLLVSWPDQPLTVAIAPGSPSGPLGLRFTGTSPRPSDDALGAAVLARPA